MSATDEEMRWADSRGVDFATWAMIDLSAAFLLFLWMNVLIDTYVGYGGRYGLAGAPVSEEAPTWAYEPVRHAAVPTQEHTAAPEAPRESIALQSYEPPTTHVLQDEDDPFDDAHRQEGAVAL